MAFTEFYCDAAAGSNVNAGDKTANGVVTSTNGGWSTVTNIFTAASGTPFSGVSVGDFASVYTDGATLAVYIGRVTTVGGGGASLTISSTAKSGTAPTTAASGITCTTGGAWKGPNSAVSFPFGFVAAAMTDASANPPRVNFKSGTNYAITAAMTHAVAGPVLFQGYTSAAGDLGRAAIDGGTSGASYILLTLSNTNAYLLDLIFANNGASGSASGVVVSNNRNYIIRCVAHDLRGNGFEGSAGVCLECEAYACNQSNTASKGGFLFDTCVWCVSHDNTGGNSIGFSTGSSGAPQAYVHCIADTNGGRGFVSGGSTQLTMINCDTYNNGSHGVDLSSRPGYLQNCNFVKNGGYGVVGAGGQPFLLNCGFGSGTQVNTSGTTSTAPSTMETGTVTYASGVTPWVDPANGDFRITLGAAKGTGRGVFTQTAASYAGALAYPDIGAAQHLDTGGAYVFGG